MMRRGAPGLHGGGRGRGPTRGHASVSEPGGVSVVNDVSLEGTRLDDTLVGMAAHLGDRAPTAAEILRRQVVGQVDDEAVGGRDVAGVVARQVARAFVGVGVRGFKASPGWDA